VIDTEHLYYWPYTGELYVRRDTGEVVTEDSEGKRLYWVTHTWFHTEEELSMYGFEYVGEV
jgi:hypothetical protein